MSNLNKLRTFILIILGEFMKKMIIILFFISCLCLFFKEDDEIINS